MSVDEITVALEQKPDHSFARGSVNVFNRKGRNHPRHGWCLESRLDTAEPLEDHLETLLSVLESRKSILDDLSSTCEMVFFCGFASHQGQGSMSLSPELLKRLADLSLWVTLDLYPPNRI
jgi:hypothetical protein